ncbi:MAG TPA: caspase family protein [Xanthobacteraceae bacterium]
MGLVGLHRIAFFLLAVVSTTSPAAAQTSQETGWCVNKENTFSADVRIKGCTATIHANAKAAWAYNNRGNAYLAKGDEDRAIADFTEAIRLDPKNMLAFYNRGIAYHAKGDEDHAIADGSQAIRLDPKYVFAFYNRGNAYHAKGDEDRAIADHSEAIRLDPKYVSAFYNRGNAYRARHDDDQAIADFGEAIRLDPGYTAAFTNRGLIYEAKGDRDRAKSDFNAAVAMAPKYDNGKSGQDIARKRLAALDASPTPVPAPDANVTKAERRIALVIGNSAYRSAPVLANPRRDADAVSAVLRAVGFQAVTLANDLTRDKLIEALRVFARQAEQADWAVVYYAGHGIQMGGVNYLIPIDAKLEVDREVDYEAVPLSQVANAVEGARKLGLIILDACRDNPFANQMRRTAATRSVGRGLARVEPEVNTLIAFSAKNGEVALDDDGGTNSPFAAAFVKEITTPGLEVRRLFDAVRDDVLESTHRRQQPFTYGSVSGRENFYFKAAR